MIRRYLPKNIEELIQWYEHYVSPFSLLVGFIIDNIAIRQLDLWLSSFILLGYLLLAAFGILLIHLIETGRLRDRYFVSAAPFIPVIVQFALGGLFSGFIILYSRSAAFTVSWIFVVLLAFLLLANERFRKMYTTFPVQVGILFFALFSFMIFYMPIILHMIGPWVFIASGMVSLGLIALFLYVASFLVPNRVHETRTQAARAVALVFILINGLYILDAIPPLPLALRDMGVFHSIQRTGSEYTVTYEPSKWYEWYSPHSRVFHKAQGEIVYVYTAIFAPNGISTKILHEWQYYDEMKNDWVTKSVSEFPINGGREGGYRGYSFKRDAIAGAWRVNVVTQYGQLIGRVSFEVEDVPQKAEVETGKR